MESQWWLIVLMFNWHTWRSIDTCVVYVKSNSSISSIIDFIYCFSFFSFLSVFFFLILSLSLSSSYSKDDDTIIVLRWHRLNLDGGLFEYPLIKRTSQMTNGSNRRSEAQHIKKQLNAFDGFCVREFVCAYIVYRKQTHTDKKNEK